ncbi:hypothetical protein GEMRC1_007513 [Eukaryota sp. GEM-RC1]
MSRKTAFSKYNHSKGVKGEPSILSSNPAPEHDSSSEAPMHHQLFASAPELSHEYRQHDPTLPDPHKTKPINQPDLPMAAPHHEAHHEPHNLMSHTGPSQHPEQEILASNEVTNPFPALDLTPRFSFITHVVIHSKSSVETFPFDRAYSLDCNLSLIAERHENIDWGDVINISFIKSELPGLEKAFLPPDVIKHLSLWRSEHPEHVPADSILEEWTKFGATVEQMKNWFYQQARIITGDEEEQVVEEEQKEVEIPQEEEAMES